MLKKRIIPCLDVKNGKVVKGIQFRGHIEMGDPEDLAQIYSDSGADELVFYDISASPENRSVDLNWIEKVAKKISIPFAVAGGIRDTKTAQNILRAGADKISINTPALKNPKLISEFAEKFGSQCVVIGIDVRDGEIFSNTGDSKKTKNTGKKLFDWVIEVEKLGAGEIVLNCMNSDGTKNGFDIMTTKKVSQISGLPIIASGGAGKVEHFSEVFQKTLVTGALAAGVFHSREIKIPQLKEQLISEKIPIRKIF